MFKLQKCWYKFKDFYSFRGLILFCVMVFMYLKYVLPYNMYHLDVLDRHYFGILNEMEPPVIKTTKEIKYFKSKGLPFWTPEDVNEQKAKDE